MAFDGNVLLLARNCTAEQPRNNKEEPYIVELQKKKLPKFQVTLNEESRYLPTTFSSPELQNQVVQTLKAVEQREELKRKSFDDDVPTPSKNVKVMPDSIAEGGEEMGRSYCIAGKPPLTVKSSKSELTLVVRNKEPLGEPSQDGRVFTPAPGLPHGGVSVNQDMSSSSSSCLIQKHSEREEIGRRNSDESMDSNGNNSEDDFEENDYGAMNMVANPHGDNLLQRLLLDRCTFDNLDIYKEHFEHAYQDCKRVLGDEHCFLEECSGPETKEYINREVASISQSFGYKSLQENHHSILFALFHHAMSCKMICCSLPLCNEFRTGMTQVQEKDSANLQRWNSSSRTDPMDVLYSNTSYFNEYDENGNIKPVMEQSNFNFVHEKFINKGSFGYVYDTWLYTPNGQARVAVKKSGGCFSTTTGLELKPELISSLESAPYLLLPNVVLSSQNGFNYLIMEKGEMSLLRYIKMQLEDHKKSCKEKDHYTCPTAGLPPDLVSLYFYQMAQGVKYLHDNGYTHGDIKPDNVLLMPGLLQAKLCDFDSVKKEQEKLQFGTYGYMAPEVRDPCVGNVLKSSDVYSLCCCIPEMLITFTMKVRLADELYRSRADALQRAVQSRDPNLGIIFEHGMQWDYKLRPTIDRIVDCFERNREMRQRILTVPGMDVPTYTIPDVDKMAGCSLARNILDDWINNIMNEQLQCFLPPIQVHVGDTDDDAVSMETDDVEQIVEDVSVEIILRGRSNSM